MNLLQLIQQPQHKKRGVPLVMAKAIAKQVLDALDFLHTVAKLIHTDLKVSFKSHPGIRT